MNKTGVVRDARYLNHVMGPYHPESPKRLEAIYAMLDEPEMRDKCMAVPVRPAAREELLLVHSEDYVDRIAATEGKEYAYLDPDTQTSAGSYEAALLAAGGVCQAVAMVNSGELDNAFALVRPPGHHAERSRAMGFCLFNNVAIGARYAQVSLDLRKILIVDWDLHHGNGTQHCFEEDSTILYFSTHQYPYYPGTGDFRETGRGEGQGYTVNIPLSPGCGDGEYMAIFEGILKPLALEFGPDIILVSAGFDIYKGDPLGGMGVTPTGFAVMTQSLMEAADHCCAGKLVMTLEGGYNVNGQRDSVKEVIKSLLGVSEVKTAEPMGKEGRARVESIRKNLFRAHGDKWNCFKTAG
ncbi:MAG: histone deacetylase [Deltaproteobacteria bacterium]|nr:histone deacetylase [Deltaproteobacteria bacterium]